MAENKTSFVMLGVCLFFCLVTVAVTLISISSSLSDSESDAKNTQNHLISSGFVSNSATRTVMEKKSLNTIQLKFVFQ